MDNFIDIKKLNIDELMGVVNLYPWFGGARKELCRRMKLMGRGESGAPEFADAAMYMGDRAKLYQMLRTPVSDASADTGKDDTRQRKVIVAGGDFFSQEEYEKVKKSEDNVFSRYAAKAKREEKKTEASLDLEFDLYTETLAGIYADQGYYEQAKRIYSKLILAYPEKNAYFAALIENLERINN